MAECDITWIDFSLSLLCVYFVSGWTDDQIQVHFSLFSWQLTPLISTVKKGSSAIALLLQKKSDFIIS